ncbi:integrase core domain-containing protein [Ferrovibrio plantarum]|uniref:integrase core domain-containing protein n=1 Tax=Ferrovibrio plantarum TaxID=3119164 RepID=UPI003F7FF7DD
MSICIARRPKAVDVIDVLSDLFVLRGVPCYIRSDNGLEFIAQAIQDWIVAVGAKMAYIIPGGPWEMAMSRASTPACATNPLNGELFYSLANARIGIEAWRQHYNTVRPHASLRYRPPAPVGLCPGNGSGGGSATPASSADHAAIA